MTTQRVVFLKIDFFSSLVSSAAAVHVAEISQFKKNIFNCHLFHQFVLLDMATTIVVIATMKLKGGFRVGWISVW